MRQHSNSCIGRAMVIALAMVAPACELSKGDSSTEHSGAMGSIQAALTVGGARHDVTAVHYKVVGASSTCGDTAIAETTSALEAEALPGGVLPPGSGTHAGADGLFVLPPGDYRVCATPMSDTEPSLECAPTEGTASVISEATTEIVLESQCGGSANGGLDTVVTLNDPPKIDDLDIAPSKFLIACETATITATAEDPDGDPTTFSWAITSSPPGAAPRLQAADAAANFAADIAGDYQVRLTVSDVYGASSSLSFPIHVSALSCEPLDQCHTAGACDLDTGACSNPTAPDGATCDDGDASTSSDVCTSGVCAGSTSSCACPAGFTTLPDGHCVRSYDIDASLLINQNESCDATGENRYNGCNGEPYGFQWTDLGGTLGAVTQVDVELETGLACAPGGRTARLNGADIGSFSTVGDCACESVHGPVSLPSVHLGTYVRGGANSVSIDPTDCEGLSRSAALGNAFARVTVTYNSACGGDTCSHDLCTTGGPLDATCDTCVGSICRADGYCCTTGWDSTCQNEVATICGLTCTADRCGDGICSASESCSSCASDCGACEACGDGICSASESCSSCASDCGACAACPGIDLGSTVPQTVTGSTVGRINGLTPICASSSAPEATYSFTAPADGTDTIDTLGSTYDTVLSVLDGTCGGAPLSCNDDFSGLQSQVNVTLTAGQTVIIVVDGYDSISGSFTLNVASSG
jgi:hypothetical protein